MKLSTRIITKILAECEVILRTKENEFQETKDFENVNQRNLYINLYDLIESFKELPKNKFYGDDLPYNYFLEMCEKLNFDVEEVTNNSCKPDKIEKAHFCFYYLQKQGVSLKVIASVLKMKDHSSVIYGVKKIKGILNTPQSNIKFYNLIKNWEQILSAELV